MVQKALARVASSLPQPLRALLEQASPPSDWERCRLSRPTLSEELHQRGYDATPRLLALVAAHNGLTGFRRLQPRQELLLPRALDGQETSPEQLGRLKDAGRLAYAEPSFFEVVQRELRRNPALVAQQERAVRLSLTREQLALSSALLRRFEALPAEKRAALVQTLDAESPGLLPAIREAKRDIEAVRVRVVERSAKPAAISALAQRYGWGDEAWQRKLLERLDEPSGSLQLFRTPGHVTVEELLSALRNPEAPDELTTSSVERLFRLLRASGKSTGQSEQEIAALKDAWARQLAQAADAAGDANAKSSPEELKAFLDAHPEQWERLTAQNLGILLHQVAQATGEPDPYLFGPLQGSEYGYIRSSFLGAFHRERNVSVVVAQAVTADDLEQRIPFDRRDRFHEDQELPAEDQVHRRGYEGSGMDRGHLAPNADAASAQNALETFLMSNMVPQFPALNQGAWSHLENAVRTVIQATGARAMIYTGALFLDATGQPLPESEVGPHLVARDGKPIAIPSHSFKSVLFRFPDGKLSTASYLLENRADTPRKVQESAELVQRSRVSIDTLERLSGVSDFFAGFVPVSLRRSLEANRTAALAPPADATPETRAAFEFLFGPQTGPSTTWQAPLSSYELSPLLLRLDTLMRQAEQPPSKSQTPSQGAPP